MVTQPDNSSQDKDKFVPPTDGSWIPKARFDEAVLNERTKAAELEGRLRQAEIDNAELKGRLAQPVVKEPAPKKFTRAELKSLAAEGKVSEDEIDDILEKQLRIELKNDLVAEIRKENANGRVEEIAATELQQYHQAFPEHKVNGSETRNKVQAEFDYLIKIGEPGNKFTELKAFRAAFGPISKIPDRTNENRQTHRESGGEGSDEDGPGNSSVWKGIPARQRKYYEAMIDRGQYTGVDDPNLKVELEYARLNTRAAK